MKKYLLINALVLFLAIANSFATSNYQLNQVIVLNEGVFGGPVTVGSYNPVTNIYTNFDTIPASFATDVIVDNGFIYVAADSLLLKYDATSKQLVNQKTIKGIRELTVWNNQILVTRGDVSALPSYFQAYNKVDLSLIYQITNLSGRAAEVKVVADSAYVAVNDFGLMGKLAVIDLNGQILNREIDLGTDGLNPESVRVEGNKVVTVSSPNWTNTAVTRFDAGTTAMQSSLLNTSSGCAASALYLSNVYFQVSGESKLKVFNTLSTSVWDSLNISQSIYGLGIDSVNGRIYAGVTDFSTFGKVFVFDFYGALKNSFDVNVSPGTFAFDVINTTGISAKFYINNVISVYPNPSVGELFVNNYADEKINLIYSIFDIAGREVVSQHSISESRNRIDLKGINSGIYFLKIESEKGTTTKKIILQ